MAVAAHEVFGREKLVKAMVTGKKAGLETGLKDVSVSSSRLWVAALIIAVLSLGLAAIVTHAPTATDESSDF